MTLFDDDVAARVTIKLVVAYDGTGFHGFAPQPGVRTVSDTLSGALARVLKEPMGLTCAGRTDAGVHAWGQVVSFDIASDVDLERLKDSINGMLASEIVVRSIESMNPDFDARRSAQWRRYRYTIVNRVAPDPFLDRYSWWIPRPLDMSALRLAADPFVGAHDFASFCRKGPEGSSITRRVLESTWSDVGDGVLRYDICAAAFCWQMVRSIVGTLVEVGLGKRRSGEMLGMIRVGDRAVVGAPAPQRGLCLWEVGY